MQIKPKINSVSDIVNLVMSSQRDKPTYFYNEAFNKKICHIDFEHLTEKDYIEIITNAYNLRLLITNVIKDISDDNLHALIKIGEDMMFATYIGVKVDKYDFLPYLKQPILDTNVKRFNGKNKSELTELTKNGNVDFYFGFCLQGGIQIAEGKPENIVKMLDGVYVIKNTKEIQRRDNITTT